MVETATNRWGGAWPARRARVLIVREQSDSTPSGAWLEHVVRLCPGALAEATSDDEPDLVVLEGGEAWAASWLRAEAAAEGSPRGRLVVLSPWTSEGAAHLLRQAADDVVSPTIAGEELCARIHAVLRRLRAATEASGMTVPLGMRRAERKLLEYLRACPGRIVTSAEILDKVFGGVRRSGTSLVRVHVSRLRRRLGPVAALRTIRGAGYVLEDHPRRPQAEEGKGSA